MISPSWAVESRVSDIAAFASGVGMAARAACICSAVSQRHASLKVPSSSRVSRVWDRPGWAARRLTAFNIGPDGGLSNRRVFAEGLGPDGICLDAEGAIWVSTGGNSIVRVAAGGQVLQHVELSERRAPFALMLGGPDRRTLFILTAEWHSGDGIASNLDRLANGPRTGQILTLPVEIPGAGRP
jgi:streptogramin lyase